MNIKNPGVNKKQKEFVDFVRNEVESSGGKLIFLESNFGTAGSPSAGEFDSATFTIKCSLQNNHLKKNEWLGVLAHEYAHFVQTNNGLKVWDEYAYHSHEIFDILTGGKAARPKRKKTRHEKIQYLINVELDCEKRAIKTLNKWELNKEDIDVENYIKSSNVILSKYCLVAEHCKFPLSESIYQTKNWLQHSPSKLFTPKQYSWKEISKESSPLATLRDELLGSIKS
jgi:hypothetical protein